MSKADVFIIESLRFDDERCQRFEGQFISKILQLGGKKCRYYYIRTRRELEHVLQKFKQSNYRYLHLSCHGNHNTIATTLDDISFVDFANMIRPCLKKKRLFLSACSVANDDLAQLLMPDSGCTSMIGPDKGVLFNDAAILWASLYHSMFAWDSKKMNGPMLREKAQAFANMFYVSLNYFGRDETTQKGYIHKRIIPQDDGKQLRVNTTPKQ
jgi:hypothetical protein